MARNSAQGGLAVSRVLIVDDHPAVREGLSLMISRQPDLMVCGEAVDVVDGLEQVEETRPDVIVVDVSLKTGNGIDLVERIKARYPQARILVLSMYPDSLYADRALRAGALGYINKQNSTGSIVEAIRRVRDDEIFLSEEIITRILRKSKRGEKEQGKTAVELLSNRELEIFKLIGEGHPTSRIASLIHLSPHTVETYRHRIKAKLGLSNASELGREAMRWTLQVNDGGEEDH